MGTKFRDIALSIAGDIIYPPPAMLYSSIAGCYIAVMLTDNVGKHGGQSVRFLENNANCNAELASDCGLTTSESSGFIVL